MSRYVEFITPENIEVSYELAGIGSRFLAAVIDHAIQIGALIAIAFGSLYLLMGASMFNGTMLGSLPLWFEAAMIALTFLVLFGYHTFYEMRWAGQTPGKRVAKLRVVRDGGYPIDFYSSLVRNLVRIVDILPPPYGAGLISVFCSQEYKRLGDWAAGTLVIKERDPGTLAGSVGVASPIVAHYLSLLPSVDGLTGEEFQAIRRFTHRRHELEIPIQAHIAMRLAMPLMQRLHIDIPIEIQWHHADLLEAIERKYVDERGVLDNRSWEQWLEAD
jgi:uncharacterized RDD family membrane protein YckC